MQNTNKKTEWNAISINGLMERPHKRQLTKTVFFLYKKSKYVLTKYLPRAERHRTNTRKNTGQRKPTF